MALGAPLGTLGAQVPTTTSRWQPEVRLDGFSGDPWGVHLGAGLGVRLGYNARLAIAGVSAAQDASVPLSVVLMVDVSGSMAGAPIEAAKAAATQFVAQLAPDDRAALYSFAGTVTPVVPLTADRAALNAGIAGLQAGGPTALYEAVETAVFAANAAPAAAKSPRSPKRVGRNAWPAACTLGTLRHSKPISAHESTPTSSQPISRVRRSALRTRSSIAPTNALSRPTRRARPCSGSW